MPGPNGEQCSTCYYFEELDGGPYGYCRKDNAELWIEQKGGLAQRTFPKVHGLLDWSGDWLDRNAPVTSFLATGGAITPTGTSFAIPSGSVWTHFNPGTLFASSIVFNVTLANDTLTWNIPGTFPPGTLFVADYAVFGSITYPSSAPDIRWTLGPDTNVPFSPDVFQRVDITNQVDDISLPFGFAGGPSISSQSGTVRVLVQSQTAETVTINSLYFQIRITVL